MPNKKAKPVLRNKLTSVLSNHNLETGGEQQLRLPLKSLFPILCGWQKWLQKYYNQKKRKVSIFWACVMLHTQGWILNICVLMYSLQKVYSVEIVCFTEKDTELTQQDWFVVSFS
jgi:hypothetical protein